MSNKFNVILSPASRIFLLIKGYKMESDGYTTIGEIEVKSDCKMLYFSTMRNERLGKYEGLYIIEDGFWWGI